MLQCQPELRPDRSTGFAVGVDVVTFRKSVRRSLDVPWDVPRMCRAVVYRLARTSPWVPPDVRRPGFPQRNGLL